MRIIQPVRLLLPLCFLILFTGCSLLQVSDRSVIDKADTFHTSLSPAVLNDNTLEGYIQSVGNRIIAAARQAESEKIGPESHFKDDDAKWMFSDKMEFHFVNSKTLNAFTTGGEHMYVYTELFQTCQSEEDLAAVMAHEFAHVYCRHVQAGTRRQYATIAGALAVGAGAAVYGGKDNALQYGTTAGGAAMAAGQFFGMGYTRKDEAQADEFGMIFYTRAGYDPNRFGHFFQIMIDKGLDKGSATLSDHPTLASRVDAASKAAKQLEPQAAQYAKAPIANPTKFKQLQAQAAKDSKSQPDDQSLAQTQQLLQALPRSCLTPAIADDQVAAQRSLKEKLDTQAKASKK